MLSKKKLQDQWKTHLLNDQFHSGVDESLGKLTTVVNLLQRTESSFPGNDCFPTSSRGSFYFLTSLFIRVLVVGWTWPPLFPHLFREFARIAIGGSFFCKRGGNFSVPLFVSLFLSSKSLISWKLRGLHVLLLETDNQWAEIF